jgi:hypothetical protein
MRGSSTKPLSTCEQLGLKLPASIRRSNSVPARRPEDGPPVAACDILLGSAHDGVWSPPHMATNISGSHHTWPTTALVATFSGYRHHWSRQSWQSAALNMSEASRHDLSARRTPIATGTPNPRSAASRPAVNECHLQQQHCSPQSLLTSSYISAPCMDCAVVSHYQTCQHRHASLPVSTTMCVIAPPIIHKSIHPQDIPSP